MKRIEEVLVLLENKVNALIQKNSALVAERDMLFMRVISLEEKLKEVEFNLDLTIKEKEDVIENVFSASTFVENLSNAIEYNLNFENNEKRDDVAVGALSTENYLELENEKLEV